MPAIYTITQKIAIFKHARTEYRGGCARLEQLVLIRFFHQNGLESAFFISHPLKLCNMALHYMCLVKSNSRRSK